MASDQERKARIAALLRTVESITRELRRALREDGLPPRIPFGLRGGTMLVAHKLSDVLLQTAADVHDAMDDVPRDRRGNMLKKVRRALGYTVP